MKKKFTIAIATAIAIAIIIAIILVIIKFTKVELNLQELNKTISESRQFNEKSMMSIDKAALSTYFEISTDEYEEAIGKMPWVNSETSMYLIIKAKKGKTNDIKQKIEGYLEKQENIWEKYHDKEYDLLKQRKLKVKGDYVYLIIAENAEEIESLIKK